MRLILILGMSCFCAVAMAQITTSEVSIEHTDLTKIQGNVAIGRSTAFATVDVQGNIRASSYFRSVSGKYTGDAPDDDYYKIRANDHGWYINGNSRMSLTESTFTVKGNTAVYSDFAGYSGEISGWLPNEKEPTLVITEDISGTKLHAVGGQVTYRGGLSFGRGGPGIYAINPNPAGSDFYGELRFHTTSWDGTWFRNYDRMVIKLNGNVGIGTISPTYRLQVDGTVRATTFSAITPPWSDFVFEEDYELRSLTQVEEFIKENKHLPDFPSEKELRETGLDLPSMDSKLLQKIEELTLYLIEQNKKIGHLMDENTELKSRIEKLEQH